MALAFGSDDVNRNIVGVLFFITKVIVEGSNGLTFALAYWSIIIRTIMIILMEIGREYLIRRIALEYIIQRQ